MTEIRTVAPEAVWPLRHRVMYPNLEFDAIKLDDDAEGIHFGLFDEGGLVSVVSVFRRGTELQFRKFATETALQGKGHGSALLKHVIDVARREGATRLWCNARRNAAGFYQRFGFRETAETFYKDGYEFVVMELPLRQRD
ncbi:MAG: GNAT family N-acetyltransferase [Chitinophagaceae bacterium]|nr:MAG: GNAT family N-acetyltransferase [Chitinophagaceae bacterium]